MVEIHSVSSSQVATAAFVIATVLIHLIQILIGSDVAGQVFGVISARITRSATIGQTILGWSSLSWKESWTHRGF